ncbi:MAG: glycosyltransferase [Steroidobacteraceae bacterium]
MDAHDGLVPDVSVCRISQRYLLVIPIPVFVAADGGFWVDAGWWKDLLLHLHHCEELVLMSPGEALREADVKAKRVRILPVRSGFEVVLLPSQATRMRAFITFPRTLALICREVRKAGIVHSSVIGWPYPIGWPANLFAMFFRRKLLVNIESAPWRATGSGRSLLDRLVSRLYETMARFSATKADLLTATQPEYISGLRGSRSRGAHAVFAATWIDGDMVVSRQAAEARWAAHVQDMPRLKLLFAGRLLATKGSELVIQLARRMAADGVFACISVIGEGDFKTRFQEESTKLGPEVLQVLEPLSYGPDFFRLISEHAAVLVPSLSDEQPRVVFDAFSQAVPVIGSSTPGIVSCVDHGLNGWLVETGSVAALFDVVTNLVSQRGELRTRGLAALEKAAAYTHQNMHETRCQVTKKVLG